MIGTNRWRAMILAVMGLVCCDVLLVSSCAPLTELINWEGVASETVGPADPPKRVPLPPTVEDFPSHESGVDRDNP